MWVGRCRLLGDGWYETVAVVVAVSVALCRLVTAGLLQ